MWNQSSFDRAQARYDNQTPEDNCEKCEVCGEFCVELNDDGICEDCERNENE